MRDKQGGNTVLSGTTLVLWGDPQYNFLNLRNHPIFLLLFEYTLSKRMVSEVILQRYTVME